MSKTRKSPARKTTKPATKARPTSKAIAPKPTTPSPAPVPAAPPTPIAKPTRDPRLPAPGALIPREYKGRVLKVKYLEDGIEVDGKRFDSLSAAARHVTGAASINGFLFFGLAGARRKPIESAAPIGPKPKKPAEPKIGNGNELATAAGQRAALAAVGITKTGGSK